MYLARLHRYNAQAEQRRHVPRRLRARRGEARGRGDRGRQIQGAAARHSVGREGHHLGQGLQDHVGIAGVQGAVVRLRRQRRRDAARRRRRADREAHDRRARRAAINGSAARRRARGIPTQGSSGSSAGPSSATAAGCVGVRHRHRDERIDSEPRRALRPRRAAADVRPHQPLRRDGAVVDAGSPRPDLPLRRGLRHRHAGDREAGRPRHERVGHPVQLERAARRQEAARRLSSRSRSTS